MLTIENWEFIFRLTVGFVHKNNVAEMSKLNRAKEILAPYEYDFVKLSGKNSYIIYVI